MAHESVPFPPPPPPPPPPPAATSLAPGFRFHPTDEELVQYYLKRKACGKPFRFEAISEIDVYKSEPWELAGYSRLKSRDLEWYFFSPLDRKYGNGSRLNRATGSGYWKATGKDRSVRHKGLTIGMKKTLVFHGGRAPDGKRTNWVMHEYRLADEDSERNRVAQDAFVLCRIFQKSGLGPPNADRYAPFVEEEWDEDASLLVPGEEAGEEIANGDGTQAEGNEHEQDTHSISEGPISICRNELPSNSKNIPFVCKRERSEDFPLPCIADPEPLCFIENKRSKHHANGSEESITTQDLCISTTTTTTPIKFSCAPLEFPLLESIEPKTSHPVDPPTFDAATLEKSVPPGYLKFISNLENEILNVSMDRETLKIEVMRAQAMINVLQSRIDLLTKENDDLKRGVHHV
ncbi:NAC domain containing protein 50-like isoform X2 [Cornus florida]|uniref:NAC domain containing protein 50-like isoform X2 n=1 Tax=Cornus florida TaxID=4283 RepID=UPI002897741B|nr:NAC domain containing protein 50-like isoform X2 [Cornus florida]